jgi:hypothetical protein
MYNATDDQIETIQAELEEIIGDDDTINVDVDRLVSCYDRFKSLVETLDFDPSVQFQNLLASCEELRTGENHLDFIAEFNEAIMQIAYEIDFPNPDAADADPVATPQPCKKQDTPKAPVKRQRESEDEGEITVRKRLFCEVIDLTRDD